MAYELQFHCKAQPEYRGLETGYPGGSAQSHGT